MRTQRASLRCIPVATARRGPVILDRTCRVAGGRWASIVDKRRVFAVSYCGRRAAVSAATATTSRSSRPGCYHAANIIAEVI